MGDLNDLAQKLQDLSDKKVTKVTRTILRETLKETNARQELISYIGSHFVKTGTYKKSVSSVQVDRVRDNHNRVIAYLYFKAIDKDKTRKDGTPTGNKMIQPRTLTHWFNAGTRSHTTGKGSRLASDKNVQQMYRNKYQIYLNNARIKYETAKSETQKQRQYERIMKLEKKLKNAYKGRKTDKQKGRKIKGITAHHFMDVIQRRVNSESVDRVTEQLQLAIGSFI